MADRSGRINIINETIQLCRDNEKLRNSFRPSVIYWEEKTEEEKTAIKDILKTKNVDKHAELLITPYRSMESARRYAVNSDKKVCVLNFASSMTPGGGVLRGTTAQEESICRISTLYPSLTSEDASPFYKKHWDMVKNGTMSRKNRDDCIYTPGVIVIREDDYDCDLLEESDWYSVDIITCAAPDLRYDDNGRTYQPSDKELQSVFEQRWRKIFEVAVLHDVDILILGAFGCGAFYNPPEVVAKAAEIICEEFSAMFDVIEFAVFDPSRDGRNYKAFSKIRGIKIVD